MSGNTCAIIHIPARPRFSPTQQPTVDVFASVIDPKLANTLVRKLNEIAPLEDLQHVKRVRKKRSSDGKTELTAILCLMGENDAEQGKMPKDVLELTETYQLSPFVVQVCKYAATTKEEWGEQYKLWPTSFHPPTYNIEGISGFNEEATKSVMSYMNSVLKLVNSGGNQLLNVALIVDPMTNNIIANARDEISSWHNLRDDNKVHSLNLNEVSISHGALDGYTLSKSNDAHSSFPGVSCLNPWQSSHQHVQSSNSCFWHPLRHAAMVAIEHSAARDRRLFPSLGDCGEKCVVEPTESPVVGSPAKRRRTSPINGENTKENPKDGIFSKYDRPYLCTGYDIYLAWEPCPMCAMALVHQRIRRIFYAFPNPNTGALGSVYRLQGEKSLNHHYAVFRVLLHDEALESVKV